MENQPNIHVFILLSFEGRITRFTFWKYWVALLVVGLLVATLPYLASFADFQPITVVATLVYYAYAVVGIISWVALSVKRWHDLNKSGWWNLVLFIPLVGPIWWFCRRGVHTGHVGSQPVWAWRALRSGLIGASLCLADFFAAGLCGGCLSCWQLF